MDKIIFLKKKTKNIRTVCCVHAWQSCSQVGRATALPSPHVWLRVCVCVMACVWRRGRRREWLSCSCSICLWILFFLFSSLSLLNPGYNSVEDCWRHLLNPRNNNNKKQNVVPLMEINCFEAKTLKNPSDNGSLVAVDSAGVFTRRMFLKSFYF